MMKKPQFRKIALWGFVWSLVLYVSMSCSPENLREGDLTGDISILASASGHKWAVGDSVFVTLLGGGSARLNVVSIRATGSAVLQGTLPEGKTLEGIAIFPYGDYLRTGSGYQLNLQNTYADGAEDRAFLVASVERGCQQLSFSPIGGKFSVSFDNIPSIARGVVFTSDTPVSGEFTLSDDASGKYTLTPTNDASKSVRIAFDGQKESGTFVFPLPVGNYANWTVAMEDEQGRLLRFALPQSALDLRIAQGTSIVKDKISFPKFNSKVTETIYGLAEGGVVSMFADDTETVLAEGITLTDIHYTKKDGNEVRSFIVIADLANAKNHFRIGAPKGDKSKFGSKKQKLSALAPYYVSETTRPTVVINGDFWCINDVDKGVNTKYLNKLRGPIHYRGEVVKSTFCYEDHWTEQALSYFGILKDGSMIIRDRDHYATQQSSLEECSGGGVILLQNGEVPDLSNKDGIDPRTAIGFHDKTLVIMVTDGRQSGWSLGLRYDEMGYIFKALGCSWAVNLDGGKSSQLLIRDPQTGTYKIHNRVCTDDGSEREVAEAWILFTDITNN